MGLVSRLRTLPGTILSWAPYIAGALSLTLCIFCWLSVDYALTEMRVVKPLMLASGHWPTTTGRIVGHAIHQEVKGRFSHMPVTHYHALPEYAFELQGHLYSSSTVCPEGGNCGLGTKEEDARALLARYPVGMEVLVSYAPELTPQLAEEQDSPWSLLQPGYRPWIDKAIRAHWVEAAASGVAALAFLVFAVLRAPEFRND